MYKILVIFIIAVSLCNSANSQDVERKEVNAGCNCKATLLDSIITQVKKNSVPQISTTQIQSNHVGVKDRIEFLNTDFATKAFSKACEVKCTDFRVGDEFHLGIIDIGIQTNDKNKCLNIIKKSQRRNFKTKVLTRFKVIDKKDELVIIYSETFRNPNIEKLFK